MSERGIVIVGAGEAGTRAAIALRDLGFGGPVILIGAERHSPYERPPLSKAALSSDVEPPLPIIRDALNLAERGIEHLAGISVIAIDRAKHALTTSDGRSVRYDRLCLALGAKPRGLGVPGGEAALYLRSFDDVLTLRHWVTRAASIAIVGGGFIGLELAARGRERGCVVTVIEISPRILTRGVPAEFADALAARHRGAGVRILTDARISHIRPDNVGAAIALETGDTIVAECVVAGVGAVPETALAAQAGLTLDNGIAVDSRLRTCDPDIFGAGDCVSFPHALYGGRRLRLEAWRNALDQGRYVAQSMLGEVAPYDVVPWFWSDQYELHLQICGLADAGTRSIERDFGNGTRIMFRLDGDGRLVAACGVGHVDKIGKEVRLAEMLIARRARPDPKSLASAAVKLKALLAVLSGVTIARV